MAIKGIGSVKSNTGATNLQNSLSSALRQLQSTVNRRSSQDTLRSSISPSTTPRGAGDKVGSQPAKNGGFGTYSAAGATKASTQATQRSAASGAPRSSTSSSGGGGAAVNTSSLGGTTAAQRQQLANAVASSSGGTAPATGTPGEADREGNATSAFGQSFVNDARDMMFKNPQAMIKAWYEFNKLGTNGGEMAMSQQANARNMMLLNTMFGPRNNTFSDNSDFGPYADFVDKHLQRGRTPGAGYYSQGQILDRLFTTDKNDPIYTQLNAEGLLPDAQANNWISAYDTALQGTMAPEMLNVHIARLGELEQQFIAQKAQGQHEGINFSQYLQANGWG